MTEIERQEQQARLKRDRYFGNQQFCEKMLIMMNAALKNKVENPSYCGDELDQIAKVDRRKALVVLEIKQETEAPLKWIAQRLKVGVSMGVSR